ncbi:MAG: heavy-metal-associated domain-containing protein [Prevotellaceae bacterium]|jgi:copper chaperone CopZ|nr:heavy-metal-associated domain-containing protein [Prevotellaceae bacterium]
MKKTILTLALALISGATIMAKDLRIAVFQVTKMHCENCVKKINDNIRFEKGVKDIAADLESHEVTVTYDADNNSIKNLQEGFKKINYEAVFIKESKKEEEK